MEIKLKELILNTPVYKRVLLKLSGEAISAGKDGILDFDYIKEIANVIKKCMQHGVQFGIIVGAGNIWRGRSGGEMDRIKADHMGMLGTCINALALQESFIREGIDTEVMTAVEMKAFAKPFVRDDAIASLNAGKVVIFGAGLGIPCVSTDTAAVVRAKEILKVQEEANKNASIETGNYTSVEDYCPCGVEIINVLRDINMDTITPLMAFGTLQNLVDKVKK